MKRLWVHEVLRVFHDRLITSEDRTILFDNLRTISNSYLKEQFDEMFAYLTNDKNPTVRNDNIFNIPVIIMFILYGFVF